MSVKVFVPRDLLETYPQIKSIKDDFTDYKSNIRIPDYFGRDADFSIHSDAKFHRLKHLHLVQSYTWLPNLRQYDRTSDKWLIYCSGYMHENYYLLIALIEPDAHAQARKSSRVGCVEA